MKRTEDKTSPSEGKDEQNQLIGSTQAKENASKNLQKETYKKAEQLQDFQFKDRQNAVKETKEIFF